MSKITRFSLLALATLLAVGAALVLSVRDAPETELERQVLFPTLAAEANQVATIEVSSRGVETVLKRSGETWVVANRDDFPALFEAVKQLVLGTASLRILEAKTRTPELYERLGVEPSDGPAAQSRRVVFKDAAGRVLVDYLVGKTRETREGGLTALKGLYVRVSDNPQALLVEGEINAPAGPVEWLRRELFDIPITRVRELRIQHADTTFTLARSLNTDTDYHVSPIPEGQRLRSQTVVNGLAAALTELRFDDVTSLAQIPFGRDASLTTLSTFDGLVVEVRSQAHAGKTWHAFRFSVDASSSASTDPPAPGETPAAEAERLNALTANWAYRLPGFKTSMLTKRLEELTVAEPAE